VVIILACHAILNAALAEIKVAIIASAAVIMFIWNGTLTAVAVHRKDIDGRRSGKASSVADGILTVIIDPSKLSKPSVASSGATGDRDFST
jgi:hypothetical protein